MFDDWTLVCKKQIINGFDVFTIPKGVILYTGVDIRYIKNISDRKSTFFATFPFASVYGLSSDYGGNSEFGSVVGYKLEDDINLLNMESECNYRLLRKLSTVPLVDGVDEDILQFAFKDGNERNSNEQTDKVLVNWMCRSVFTKNMLKHKIYGYAYTSKMNNHDEIMICKEIINSLSTFTKPTLIYRILMYMNVEIRHNKLIPSKKYKLYETKDGEFTGKIIDINDDLKFRIGSKEIHHLLKYNLRYDEYIPYGSNLDHWMERRVMIRNKDIDKFMFTEPFESKRIEILNHLFYHSNDKSEYIEDCPKTYKLLKKTIDNKLSDR